jgi:hypothetical protein
MGEKSDIGTAAELKRTPENKGYYCKIRGK